ncbi:hypothetical protein RhiJN_23303 [Ceratobasidium sp. AG-Ba]|nr:hypothetical protein RhiJN_23303 [Ceratobasidium sp. AG-Ba]
MFSWFPPRRSTLEPQEPVTNAALHTALGSGVEHLPDPSLPDQNSAPAFPSHVPRRPDRALPNRDLASNDAPAEDTEFLRGIGREAQVWTTYVKETKEHDDDMVDGWNRSLDVTLAKFNVRSETVFAALFSAILTAFVLESAKQLEPDPAEQTVTLLMEISQKLDGDRDQSPSARSANAAIVLDFSPSNNAVWVNCLWFLSLSISVAVSLAAMLAKQWCFYYLSSRTGDTITQAEERQKRFGGLAKWRMRGILEHLPMLMHIALGLILYLWDINVAVASTVSAVSVTALCFYLGTILLPVWDSYCPYKTTQAVYTRKALDYVARHFPSLRPFLAPFLKQLPQAQNQRTQAAQNNRNIPTQNTPTLYHSIWATVTRLFRTPLGSQAPAPQNLEARQNLDAPPDSENTPASSHIGIPVTDAVPDDQDSSDSLCSEDEPEPFVKDALEWLIFNSQKSSSIDTAIGALAIGRVKFEGDDLKRQINLHLVKHFSDRFTTSRDGPRLQLSHHQGALQSALDYINWMSYFAENSRFSIKDRLLDFQQSLDSELVTRLGLALASLADQKSLSHDAGKNVASWLSAFVECYAERRLYLNEEHLSILIDGLTITGRYVKPDLSPKERAMALEIPHLISILWIVSHIEDSPLRSSIGLNLAVFALTTDLHHPMDRQPFEMVASRLAYDYRNPKDREESFVSFATFALHGILHPEAGLGLDKSVLDTAAQIIHETGYLDRQNISIRIPNLFESHTLRCHLPLMLIETMIKSHGGREYLIYTAYKTPTIPHGWENQKFESTIQAVHRIINAHLEGEAILHDDAITAATELLYKEVRKLRRLDAEIIGFQTPERNEKGTSLVNTESPDDHINDTGSRAPNEVASEAQASMRNEERLASQALETIMKKSNNKECLEIAVNAVLFHSRKCEVELVIQATKWLANEFRGIGPGSELNENHLLHICGYIRILVSMAMHCPDPAALAVQLYRPDVSSSSLSLFEKIEKIMQILVIKTKDTHVRVLGEACHSTWKYACSNETYDRSFTVDPLEKIWALIASDTVSSQVEPSYRASACRSNRHMFCPEAIEALVDTTVLFASITEPKCMISDSEIRILLHLLGQHTLDTNHPVRLSLAVAFGFWGLLLDAEDWDFWSLKDRKKYWRLYIKQEERTRDVAALFLLGLARILAHYKELRLNHASIKTIAHEIDHYMLHHAGHPDTLSLPFLSGYDVRRHVRESVRTYLQETESQGPFTKSTTASREKLRTALQYEGGEGFLYEIPQPFKRISRGVSFSGASFVDLQEAHKSYVPPLLGRISRGVSVSEADLPRTSHGEHSPKA